MDAGPLFFKESPLIGNVCALAFSFCFALSLLRIFEETAKRGVFDQKLNRKLVHITMGLAFMLFWPLFSSGSQGAVVAALVPGINIVKMLLIGLGIMKDDAIVKSMTRFGDYRELIKGPLYYSSTIPFITIIYWRTSPIGIAAICNVCAGDGFADIIGRRFGRRKLPYNCDKSFAGSMAMAIAGFIASLGFISSNNCASGSGSKENVKKNEEHPGSPPSGLFMYYFSVFGFVEKKLQMVVGFFIVSLLSALVESHPISTKFDDNLTVPLASMLVGTLVF